MKKIRAILVDDEPPSLTTLRTMLRGSGVEVVGECTNGLEAVEAVEKFRPDLLFLDIQMPGMDGFGVLEKLNPKKMPHVVFVTAYDQYALKAFEANALDYVLKPYDHERLTAAIDKVIRQIKLESKKTAKEEQAVLFKEGRGADHYIHRLLIKKGGRIRLLKVQDIDWIEASGNYIRIHVKNESHMLHEKIGDIEEKLDPAQFARIHRSSIVNLERVKEFEPLFHTDYVVILNDGQRLTLSRSHREKVFQALTRDTSTV